MRNIFSIFWIEILLQTCNGWMPSLLHDYRGNSDLNMGGYDATVGTDPSAPMQFFTLPGNTCPYAQRTLITLLELGISFDTCEVSFTPSKPEWYLKINPRGKVPAIRIPENNQVVYESSICNEFLCDYSSMTLKRTHELMPNNPMLRAKVRLLNDHCDNVFTKTQFTFLMNKNKEKDEELLMAMEHALTFFQDVLTETDGPFLLGSQFTLSDIHLFPFLLRLIVTLRHFKSYELPIEKFPALLTWFDTCSQRDAVKKTLITDQKIIEIYNRFLQIDYKFGGLNVNK